MTMPTVETVESLQKQVDDLQWQVDILRTAFSEEEFLPPSCLKIPRRELQILRILLKRPNYCTSAELAAVLYFNQAEAPDDCVIESHVSKLRKRLRPFGIKIESARYLGYRLDATMKGRLRAMSQKADAHG